MPATLDSASLQRILSDFTSRFTPELAAHFTNLPPSEEFQATLDELGTKANEGTLTEAERREYETYVEVLDVLALLRVKALQKSNGASRA
jgi:hypothetical protein